jgi:CARDB protein
MMGRGTCLVFTRFALATFISAVGLSGSMPAAPAPVASASHLRPSAHPLPNAVRTETTVTLGDPGQWSLWKQKLQSGDFCDDARLNPHDLGATPGTPVGHWNFAEQIGGFYHDCQNSEVWQSRVEFDLEPLKDYPGIEIQSAELQFAEQRVDDTDAAHPSCVGYVRIASSDQPGEDGLFQRLNASLPETGTRRWDVLYPLERWRSGAGPDFGLVFSGLDEEFDFNNAACVSMLSDFKIIVNFTWDKPRGPDLNVTDLRIADSSGGGQCTSGQINATATVQNKGDVASPGFNLVLQVNGDDSEIMPMAALAPGAEKTVTFGAASLLLGPNKVLVVADPADGVAELDEDNNLESMLVACAQAGPRVDLPVTQTQQGTRIADKIQTIPDKSVELTLDSVKFIAGQGKDTCSASIPHTMMAVLKNGGTETLASVSLQLLVDGQARATTTASGIGPQAPVNAYFDNVTLSKGTHTLVVVVDPDNKVIEGNEQDNKATIQVSCK